MTASNTPSILADLRSFIPKRPITFSQAKQIAERQANRLLALANVTSIPVPSGGIVSTLPRIRIALNELPPQISGSTHWNGTQWVILIDRDSSPARQRFTLMHEFKHIIDHGNVENLYTGNSRYTSAEQAERVADYFAASFLMPKRFLKSAWSHGLQTSARLAREFEVSIQAMEVRLNQTGINRVADTIPVLLPNPDQSPFPPRRSLLEVAPW